jgi:hypothetical protein
MDNRSAALIATLFEESTLLRKEAYELMLASNDRDGILTQQKFQSLEDVTRSFQAKMKEIRVDFIRKAEDED